MRRSSSRPCLPSCARAPCRSGTSSAGPLGVPASLVAHPEEAARSEAGILHNAALGPALGTRTLPGGFAALLCRLGLFLCHVEGGEKNSPGRVQGSRRTDVLCTGACRLCQGSMACLRPP